MALFFRKRLVRVHFRDEDRSLEGIWVGFEAGHYKLAAPKQLEASDRTFPVEGFALIPRERVFWIQELVQAAT